VLAKIAQELAASGLVMGDVVKMNVFLVGDPARGGTMDFDGLMRAYGRHFGTASGGRLPARTTVQVAGLPIPGALVEIEVVAARTAPR
jgi:enamine deaminase RidA (YjgF/YER057c/UK114 family)